MIKPNIIEFCDGCEGFEFKHIHVEFEEHEYIMWISVDELMFWVGDTTISKTDGKFTLHADQIAELECCENIYHMCKNGDLY